MLSSYELIPLYSVHAGDLPVGAIVGIVISGLVVVLAIVTVVVVAVIVGWKRWNHDNGTFDLRTDVSVVNEAFRHLILQCECFCMWHKPVSYRYVRNWHRMYIV